MRFRDIELHDVRGISSLAISGLAERGVIVISGENESGKTTIAKAIQTALTSKWKSRSADALGLHSSTSQAKPHIKLRLELDGYDFTLDKIFGGTKDCGTIINVHSPRPETFRDEEAESWLEARMKSADTKKLWDVFVAEQGKAQETLSFGGYSQVTSALQSASGQRAETAQEIGLYEAVKQEYAAYFSEKSGQPRKPLIEAEARLKVAEENCSVAAERVREFDQLNEEAAMNEQSQSSRQQDLPEAKREVDFWTEQLNGLEQFREIVRTAEEASIGAEQRLGAAKDEKQTRDDLIRQVQEASTKVDEVQKQVATLKEHADAEAAKLEQARRQRDALVATCRQAREAEEIAVVKAGLAVQRIRAERLSVRMEKVKQLRTQLAELKEVLRHIHVTDSVLDNLLNCQRDVVTARAILDAASPKIELTASSPRQVKIDGEDLELKPGADAVQRSVTQHLSLAIGDVTVSIQPGAGADSQQRRLDDARQAMQRQLQEAGVADIGEAQEANSRRRTAEKKAFQVETSVEAELDGLTFHQLVEDCEESNARVRELSEQFRELAGQEAPAEIDVEAAKGEASHATKIRKEADNEREIVEKRLTELEGQPARAHHTAAASELEGYQSKLVTLTDLLSAARQKITDEQISAALESREGDLRAANEKLEAAQAELARIDAEDVEVSLAGATQSMARIEKNLSELKARRQQIDVHLGYFESANETLAEAEGERQRAQREYDSVHRRAVAAKTLFEVMKKSRMASRDALAKPLLRKLDEYGGSVFGAGTVFTMNSELKIESRSNDGGDFAVEDLSGGAREQLDVLLRLAAAGVMEGGQGAPVILDDALGYSDEYRLRKMNNAISKAGHDMQVIVLTCDERRFIRIPGAEFLRIRDLVTS